jgi:hypothetical protein
LQAAKSLNIKIINTTTTLAPTITFIITTTAQASKEAAKEFKVTLKANSRRKMKITKLSSNTHKFLNPTTIRIAEA